MTEAEIRRLQRFPEIVDCTMRKLRGLEEEARRYRDRDILSCLEAVNAAWDREVMLAYAENTERKDAA